MLHDAKEIMTKDLKAKNRKKPDRQQTVLCQRELNQALGNLLKGWVRTDLWGNVLIVCLFLVSAGLAISNPDAPAQTEAQPKPTVPIKPPAAGESPTPGQEGGEFVWPSNPPSNCPFAGSAEITGIAFTGRHKEYENADTWFPSWASDGNLYSPYADGTVGGVETSSKGPHPTTGQAVIIGDDPLNLTVKSLGVHSDPATPYLGRYPIGTLVLRSINTLTYQAASGLPV